MQSRPSMPARLTLTLPIALAVMAGCNTSTRRAEKAMDLCIRMEDEFMEVATKALVDPSNEDLDAMTKAKLNLRASRAQMKAEATGDALVLRCAQRMDELEKGIVGMEGSILNELRLQLANDQRIAKFLNEQRSLAGLPASYRASADQKFQKVQADMKERMSDIEAGEPRCNPLEAVSMELPQAKTRILELLPAR